MRRVFAFEGDNTQTLEWIPLDVRRRLDLAGVRLSLAGWQALPMQERVRFCEAPVDAPGDVAAYRAAVLAAAPAGSAVPIEPIPFDARPWTDAVDRVVERARALGVAVDPARWASLDDAARYALHRLSDPKKTEEKLRAALVELGLAG